MNRRQMILGSATALAGLSTSSFAFAWTPSDKKRSILMFTKSSGFEHSVIKRTEGKLGLVEQIVTDLGAEHGFEVTCTKDGTIFTPENLEKYDAFFFYTTGNLTQPGTDMNPPMSPEGKNAFLEAIKKGKGFIGTHAATDTFHTEPDPPDRSNRYINHGDKVDPYAAMIGGEFIKHGPQQSATMKVIDTKFPGFSSVGSSFDLMEEWYSIKDFQPNLHVLLVQETAGMKGPEYKRAPYPATWARMHGKGRVFYTSMGHREDVWTNPILRNILLGGIAWAVGNVRADVAPNLESAAPGYREIPPKA